MLELKNVSKVYKTKSGRVGALNGVSLTFPSSGLVFITGKSGSGKTTLLNVVGGLDGIDEGEICLLGKSFASFSQSDYDDYRNTFIGFIFQEYNLLSEYSVEKNIQIAMELQGRQCDKEELDALLKEMEIENLKTRKPLELSGGQRQRVAIARALVKKPRIIMADEPTGALDSKTGIQVLEILKKLSKDKLIIVVSHDEELAERYADRIIRLVDGVVESDLTFSETETEDNVSEGDKTVLVRAGADLSESEKDVVALAIKQSKKIELINSVSHRKIIPTKEVDVVKTTDKFELKRSKMKIKSSVSLGAKSLVVKPVRLIFTILLSVVAFAVFGLFDTVANFSTAKVVNNLLRNTSSTVSVYGEYIADKDSDECYDVKLSQSKLDEISKRTGLKIKGIYDFKDNESGYVRQNYVIQELGGYKDIVGKNYYSRIINGFVEFKDSEFSSDGKTVSAFGYKVVQGRYPKLVYENNNNGVLTVTQESLSEIAISTFMAESIVHLINGSEINGKLVETTADLLDAKITVNNKKYTIVGLIDCGSIPEKYDVLKSVASLDNETTLLANNLLSYIDSGVYKCLFVAEGFKREIDAVNNDATIYYAGKASWTISIPNNSYSRGMSDFVYSESDYFNDEAVFFGGERASNDKISLADDEVLIHAENVKTLFEKEIAALEGSVKNEAQTLAKEIASLEFTVGEKQLKLEKLMMVLGLSDKSAREKTITIAKQTISTGEQTVQRVKVVGFYVGIDLNDVPSSTEFRFMMNDNLLSVFDIYLDQGEYSRFIFCPNDNVGGTRVIANYMLAEEGLSLVWFGNSALHTIQSNEAIIRQGANLFLYISLALAVFSVFMLSNYILTSIVNKRPTIGVLRGLGSGGRDIMRIFLSESLIIAIINGILATLLTVLGCVFVNGYIMNVMNIAIPFALFGVRQLGMIFGLSISAAIISSTLPIVNIAKKKPVDLIRTF